MTNYNKYDDEVFYHIYHRGAPTIFNYKSGKNYDYGEGYIWILLPNEIDILLDVKLN